MKLAALLFCLVFSNVIVNCSDNQRSGKKNSTLIKENLDNKITVNNDKVIVVHDEEAPKKSCACTMPGSPNEFNQGVFGQCMAEGKTAGLDCTVMAAPSIAN